MMTNVVNGGGCVEVMFTAFTVSDDLFSED
jgi:hypothetical protein